jgi:uncharacterized RDD family membrane protein YckC
MKCHGCGHEFPHTAARCPRCHRSLTRRPRTSTDSRLLEFPRRSRTAQPVETKTAPLPAWRVELNEKVRAIRANRVTTTPQSEKIPEAPIASPETVVRAAGTSALQDPADIFYPTESMPRSVAARQEVSQAATSDGRRSSNNIVEAALIRVKRATENASRAALPKIEPARSIQPSQVLAVDRQATARALEPAPEIEQRVEIAAAPAATPTPAPTPEPEAVQAAPVVIQPVDETPTIVDAAPVSIPEPELESIPAAESPTVLILDEIEPLDYLEAEVRKVDQALGREFLKNESPSIFTHAVISIVDLLAVAVSCSPFLAFIRIADGSFSVTQTRLATFAIVGLVAFFYLALTQCLSGRTFGMMLTNTRVVDSLGFECPTASQSLLRTAGYFVAVAPAFAGILWAAIDHKHRGFQDLISRTVVVRDF